MVALLDILLGEKMQGSQACCLGGMTKGNTWLARLPGEEVWEEQLTDLCVAWGQTPMGITKQSLLCPYFCYFMNHFVPRSSPCATAQCFCRKTSQSQEVPMQKTISSSYPKQCIPNRNQKYLLGWELGPKVTQTLRSQGPNGLVSLRLETDNNNNYLSPLMYHVVCWNLCRNYLVYSSKGPKM